MYRRVHWKRNIRKVPDSILSKIEELQAEEIVASVVAAVPSARITEGEYVHLGVSLDDQGILRTTERILPPADSGKYSTKNRCGEEIVRRDLEKIPRPYVMDSPNFGDWSKGSHPVTLLVMAYPREYRCPQEREILVTPMGYDPVQDHHVIRFVVDHILNRNSESFLNDLLFDLNLLQENTGKVDVAIHDHDIGHVPPTLTVDWEILPIGTSEAQIVQRVYRTRRVTDAQRGRVRERIRFFASLNPVSLVVGASGFARYLGAYFTDHLVVFENMDYGNAVYVMFRDWEHLSRLSKTELLSGTCTDFRRILHSGNWMQKVRNVIQQQLDQGGIA